MIVWTVEYVPFAMGGDVWQPIKTDVDIKQRITIGEYEFVVIKHPVHEQYHIAEAVTGALVQVGKTEAEAIENIARDCKAIDTEILRTQLDEARQAVSRARSVEPNEFWRKLKSI